MKKKSKKNNNIKVIMFTVGGVLVALCILYFLLFVVEYSKNMVWHSGKVLVGENIVSLPTTMSDFERSFNPDIQFVKDEEFTRRVNVSGYRFSIFLKKDRVVGMVLNSDDNDEVLNDSIIFPGDITVNSSMKVVKRTYGTTPLNVFKRSCFVNLPGGEKHDCVKYANNKYEIEVYTIGDKISSIRYFYIGF